MHYYEQTRMTPHDWLLSQIDQGKYPVVLGDRRAPHGGVPVFCMPMVDAAGNLIPPAHHLFNPDPRLRVCAMIGLSRGAHGIWDRLGLGHAGDS